MIESLIKYKYNKMNITIKIFLLFSMIIKVISDLVQSNKNSSTCYYLYLNNTIDQKCINITACCYYEFQFNNKLFENNCILKLNPKESICKNFSAIIERMGGKFTICSCFSMFFRHSLYISIILILLT